MSPHSLIVPKVEINRKELNYLEEKDDILPRRKVQHISYTHHVSGQAEQTAFGILQISLA